MAVHVGPGEPSASPMTSTVWSSLPAAPASEGTVDVSFTSASPACAGGGVDASAVAPEEESLHEITPSERRMSDGTQDGCLRAEHHRSPSLPGEEGVESIARVPFSDPIACVLSALLPSAATPFARGFLRRRKHGGGGARRGSPIRPKGNNISVRPRPKAGVWPWTKGYEATCARTGESSDAGRLRADDGKVLQTPDGGLSSPP